MEKRATYRGWVGAIALLIVALTATSCAVTTYRPAASYTTDDMYAVHNPKEIADKDEQKRVATEQLKEQRMQQWASALGMESTSTPTITRVMSSDDSYNTPYGERLLALSAGTSYSSSAYYEALEELADYDPDRYSASISSDGEITIEPKYSASIYGSWDNDYYYNSAWIYGYPMWSYRYMYGYPGFAWSPWGFSMGYYYNPWYYTYPYYYSFHYPRRPYYRPVYRPSYKPTYNKSRTIVKTADPYKSPSSNSSVTVNRGTTRSNGATVGRSSTTNSSSYNRSATSSYSSPSSSSVSRSSSSSSFSRPSSSSSSSSSSTNSFGR